MSEVSHEDLIYDWNEKGQTQGYVGKQVMLTDETLRDGLQSPSVVHPSLDDKLRLVWLMRDLSIDAADLGFAGAGPTFRDEIARLAREINDNDMGIQPQSAARSLVADVRPIVDASQAAGLPIEAAIFIGSSAIRRYVEGWQIETMVENTIESVSFAVENGLPVMFVTEDTTRASPDTLKLLYGAAIDAGATRICLSDSVGHITPMGTVALVDFVKREIVGESNGHIGIDWHGHRDRGLSIPNALAAIASGADRIHACALGIGERAGNTPMELMLVNLQLMGLGKRDLTRLPDYVRTVVETCNAPLPFNYPVVGEDAFRTTTGVHAAAIRKAMAHGDEWLADSVYSGVSASMVGREQVIQIGPLSGEHNVRHWLLQHHLEDDDTLVQKVLSAAKDADATLSNEAIYEIVASHQQAVFFE